MLCFKSKFINHFYKLLMLFLLKIILVGNVYALSKSSPNTTSNKVSDTQETFLDNIDDYIKNPWKRLLDLLDGKDPNKNDKSYSISTITNNIISRLSNNISHRNNSSLIDSTLNFVNHDAYANQATTNDYYIYCSYGLEQSDSKYKRNSANCATIKSSIINAGININFSSIMAFGLGYGLVDNDIQARLLKDNQKIGSESIKTNVVLTYGYIDLSMIKTNITGMYGFSKHDPKVENNDRPNYNSKFFAARLDGELELNLILFSLHLIGHIATARIETESYKIDSKNIPEVKSQLYNAGLAFTTLNTLDIKIIKFDSRLTVGYDYTKFTGDSDIINININQKVNVASLAVNKKPGYAHALYFNASVNLQLYKHLQLSLDINYNYGFDISHFKNTFRSTGAVASVSYLF